MTQRVRLLAAHGADLTARFSTEAVVPASAASALHGYTPAELAALSGHRRTRRGAIVATVRA